MTKQLHVAPPLRTWMEALDNKTRTPK